MALFCQRNSVTGCCFRGYSVYVWCERDREGSDAGAGEGVASFAEDDEAAVAGDVGFHHVLCRVRVSLGEWCRGDGIRGGEVVIEHLWPLGRRWKW